MADPALTAHEFTLVFLFQSTPQEDVKLISERLKRAQQDFESREHHDHPRH